MSDEKRIIYIGPRNIKLGVSPHRNVALTLDYEQTILGLAPDLVLGIELTPTEARHLAKALQRKADEAEDGLPRA